MERRVVTDERSTRAAIAEARGFRSADHMQDFYEKRGSYPDGTPVERSDEAQNERDLETAVSFYQTLLADGEAR